MQKEIFEQTESVVNTMRDIHRQILIVRGGYRGAAGRRPQPLHAAPLYRVKKGDQFFPFSAKHQFKIRKNQLNTLESDLILKR